MRSGQTASTTLRQGHGSITATVLQLALPAVHVQVLAATSNGVI